MEWIKAISFFFSEDVSQEKFNTRRYARINFIKQYINYNY